MRVEEVCALCECPGHPITVCPSFPIVKKAYHSNQAEVNAINQYWDPYSNTYNPGWAQNPLLGWRDQKTPVQPQAPPQPQAQQFRPPQGQMTQFRYLPQQQQGLEEANAITTLRSGKVIDKDLPPKKKSVPPTVPVAAPAVVPDLGSVPKEERKTEPPKVVVSAPAVPMTQTPHVAPYPNRLVAKPKANFAKVLKDLCTSKRRTKSQDKVLLTEQVSSIFQADIPTKCKDPGCPTIPIAIAGQKFDKALLDLGASVNLLRYSVYLRLGLGDLRATPVTLQLADRSIRIPKGVVEDVLVQVGEFLFPVDFIVLDTCQIQEVNVFNIDSRVKDDKEVYEVSLVDTLVQEHVDSILYKDPLEIALTAKEASFLDFPEIFEFCAKRIHSVYGYSLLKTLTRLHSSSKDRLEVMESYDAKYSATHRPYMYFTDKQVKKSSCDGLPKGMEIEPSHSTVGTVLDYWVVGTH
ncbi:uncharacterized protein LOC131298717 [Rhododendron vialii]|uniref:uncharacterized protein LOC131298717 n=1 Tax=Rhododendron vialii TaxID=182163 RepID=UPI0026603817|nr:uncharacterized protein LOC131298717 [Rhododendron vialii]